MERFGGPGNESDDQPTGERDRVEPLQQPSGQQGRVPSPLPTTEQGLRGRSQPPAPEAGGGTAPGAMPWESTQRTSPQPSSRVSVIDEQPPRPAPPEGASEEDYKWHTYRVYPSGRPDAVEFIDVYKSFGRARILAGLNMGLPEGMVSMIIGPSGTGKSVCIKHMVGLLYPDQGDVVVHGESVPNMADDD